MKYSTGRTEMKNMDPLKTAIAHWEKISLQEQSRLWIGRLMSGNVALEHYKGFLLETYHNAGLNPQLQGYTTLFFNGRPRNIVKKFFQHAISEIGHDLLAMEDLKTLGVKEDFILNSQPLPETKSFYANAIWGIQNLGPIYYLGYLFHLEYNPTKNGFKYIEMLLAKGIPKEATTFLEEHATVDIAHTKLMEMYIAEFIKTEKDLALLLQSMTDFIRLHNNVLIAAFENGEKIFKD